MPQLFVLFEHATGVAIFRTSEFEEIGVFLPQVRRSITNVSKFRSIVHLVAFQPFTEQKEALSYMKSTVAAELNIDLQLFLENNVPRTKKSKQTVVLGVVDPLLAAAISDKLGIKCSTSGVVMDIIRGVRVHFQKFVKGFKEIKYAKEAEVSLGHHYTQVVVNYDARRQDCMIIESNILVDQLDKDIRTLTRRIKGWYSIHFPELFKVLQGDDELYVQCVQTIGDRKDMPNDVEEQLSTLIGDSSIVEAILLAAHNSMGLEVSLIDLENMKMICSRVLSLIEKRKNSLEYLKIKLNKNAPNMTALVGELVASRLISRAGGLTKLAKLPASTVQILGADKKLFRSVKGVDKPATCGLISEAAFIGKAGKSKKGHLARILANKCCLAARVDCFSKKSDKTFGKELTGKVEEIVRLHKHFRREMIKNENSKLSTIDNETAVNKKSKKMKKKDHPSVNNNSTPVKNSVKLAAEQSSEENEVNADSDVIKDKGEKELSNAVKTDESTVEDSPKPKRINLRKRKSKANELSIAENLDDETSAMERNGVVAETPLKRSRRLAKKK